MESPLQRLREPVLASAITDFPPEFDIAGFVGSLPSSSPSVVEEALDRLIELTVWQEENQRAVAELGGPSLVVDLAKVRAKYLASQAQPPADGPDGADLRTVIKSLQLLLNLTANEYLALRTGEVGHEINCFLTCLPIMPFQSFKKPSTQMDLKPHALAVPCDIAFMTHLHPCRCQDVYPCLWGCWATATHLCAYCPCVCSST